MNNAVATLKKTYEALVLDRPVVALLLVFSVVLSLGFFAPQFRLDASSDSLALENDQAVKYYRSIKARYGSDDFLIITYTPEKDLFSPATLTALQALRDDLAALERVTNVTSILDVPLINSPPVSINELSDNVRTLTDPETDQKLAMQELINSPLYRDLLMSKDGQTTALLVSFQIDNVLQKLIDERAQFHDLKEQRKLTKEERRELAFIEQSYGARNARFLEQQQRDTADIRAVLRRHQNGVDIYLGGVPMVISDSIDYIRQDLKTFGLGVFLFVIVLLSLIFRKPRWVILPMLTCFSVGIGIIGFLGLVDWPVTIVSANFISLLLIFTLSFTVHQTVCYRELHADNPSAPQRALVQGMVSKIAMPCFYMSFTTAVAFGSLVVSNIRPIIDFGWMMSIGIGLAFIIAFTLMPSALMLLKPLKPPSHDDITARVTEFLAHLAQRHGKFILSTFFALVILSVWGMSFLYVQNRFIDYYQKDTDIYQGMVTIDRKLGGTTPLDVIIDAPQSFLDAQEEERAYLEEEGLDLFMDGPSMTEGYWFNEVLLEDVSAIHTYLESLPETGKVLSFDTAITMLRDLDETALMDRFYLSVLYGKLPEPVKDILLAPYISEDGNQLRFAVRVFESHEGLNREELLKTIRAHLTEEIGLADDQVNLTGMVVLYNNVLQTLFRSQILTIWVVFITIYIVFVLVFRSFYVAAVAVIPNITIAGLVLGIMGWLHIPLDIMTITIAAICTGVADDNTIHYVHRFMNEFKQSGSYKKALERSHRSIGRAMYYTSITVILGFSILGFSNFVPTVYFGLLTAFVMLVALLASLILLPLLLVLFKPLGQDRAAAQEPQ